jgi:hypothetical protein
VWRERQVALALRLHAVASKPSLQRSEWQLGAKAQFASPFEDFCNKIGTKRTYRDDLLFVRFRGKADMREVPSAYPFGAKNGI